MVKTINHLGALAAAVGLLAAVGVLVRTRMGCTVGGLRALDRGQRQRGPGA
jgi:hypothetical protein